ncbi:hypothetical protein BJ742DRAFT_739495 [Cladochytrium replicatum]|nr:hypothetical protein BJ742DRAFT_739495 [Cladochytrium replicatum]
MHFQYMLEGFEDPYTPPDERLELGIATSNSCSPLMVMRGRWGKSWEVNVLVKVQAKLVNVEGLVNVTHKRRQCKTLGSRINTCDHGKPKLSDVVVWRIHQSNLERKPTGLGECRHKTATIAIRPAGQQLDDWGWEGLVGSKYSNVIFSQANGRSWPKGRVCAVFAWMTIPKQIVIELEEVKAERVGIRDNSSIGLGSHNQRDDDGKTQAGKMQGWFPKVELLGKWVTGGCGCNKCEPVSIYYSGNDYANLTNWFLTGITDVLNVGGPESSIQSRLELSWLDSCSRLKTRLISRSIGEAHREEAEFKVTKTSTDRGLVPIVRMDPDVVKAIAEILARHSVLNGDVVEGMEVDDKVDGAVICWEQTDTRSVVGGGYIKNPSLNEGGGGGLPNVRVWPMPTHIVMIATIFGPW